MPRSLSPNWLRRDLLLRLLLPLFMIMAATAALGTYTAHRLTARVFDHWLLDASHSLGVLLRFDGSRVSIDLPERFKIALLYDDIDETYFGIVHGHQTIAGRADIPQHGDAEVEYDQGRSYDAQIDGRPVRVAAVDVKQLGTQDVTIYVAETLIKRQRSESDLLVIIWPMAALILAAAAVIILAVRRTLRPLESIASRWRAMSNASLDPVGHDDVPRELVPFARALNDLLARIRAMISRERNFSTMVAHQLRTPLTSLQLGLARAADAPDLPAAKAVIAELSRATQRSARLVQQLLALGRLDPEAGRSADFQNTDLVRLIRDVGAAHADQAVAKNIDFEMITATKEVCAEVQADLFAEAVSNIIDNAIRYTPQGGHVSVEVRSSPVQILVSDSGPGVPLDERERVFERFVRGRLAEGEGSGLGLAIVRDIAGLHRATVEISDSPWGGLTVAVAFEGADA